MHYDNVIKCNKLVKSLFLLKYIMPVRRNRNVKKKKVQKIRRIKGKRNQRKN